MDEISKRIEFRNIYLSSFVKIYSVLEMHPSVRSGNNFPVSVLSSWSLTLFSAHGVVWSNEWAKLTNSVMLDHTLKGSLALFSFLAGGNVVLTISPVEIRHMGLAEHSAASLPENWSHESVLGMHEFVLSVTVAISCVVATFLVAFGVWDSDVLSLTQSVVTMGSTAASDGVFDIDIRWGVLFLRCGLSHHHWVWSHHHGFKFFEFIKLIL